MTFEILLQRSRRSGSLKSWVMVVVGESAAASGNQKDASGNQKVTDEKHRLKKFATYADCVRCSTQQTKDTLKNKDILGMKDMNEVQI